MNRGIQHFTVIYLALIILIRMLAMPISLMEYSLNKNFIAASLCENRFKSEIHCAGTCYLTKKLAKANESQDAPDQKGSSKSVVIDFFESIMHPSFACSIFASHSFFLHPKSADPQSGSQLTFSPSHCVRNAPYVSIPFFLQGFRQLLTS